MGSSYVCIECGHVADKLFYYLNSTSITSSTSSNRMTSRSSGKTAPAPVPQTFEPELILSTCQRCNSIVDKYVEYDLLLVVFDILMQKPSAFRHIFFNRSRMYTAPAYTTSSWLLLLFFVLVQVHINLSTSFFTPPTWMMSWSSVSSRTGAVGTASMPWSGGPLGRPYGFMQDGEEGSGRRSVDMYRLLLLGLHSAVPFCILVVSQTVLVHAILQRYGSTAAGTSSASSSSSSSPASPPAFAALSFAELFHCCVVSHLGSVFLLIKLIWQDPLLAQVLPLFHIALAAASMKHLFGTLWPPATSSGSSVIPVVPVVSISVTLLAWLARYGCLLSLHTIFPVSDVT